MIIDGAAATVVCQRPLNQDYFTANQSTDLSNLLKSVDFNHTKRAMDLILKGQTNYAIQDLKYTLDTFPNHPKALLLLGFAANQAKTPSLPIAYYEKALRLYPKYASTHTQYGEYLVSIGLVDKGIERLNNAIEIDVNFISAYECLSKAYSRIGNREMEKIADEKARELRGKAGK